MKVLITIIDIILTVVMLVIVSICLNAKSYFLAVLTLIIYAVILVELNNRRNKPQNRP